MKPEGYLIFDIETDGKDSKKCNLKWFGCYSSKSKIYTLVDYKCKNYIKNLIKSHKILIGFNSKQFDQPVIKRYLDDDNIFNYKVQLDLWEISAPKGTGGFGIYNKDRLGQAGIKLPNYKLKTICDYLGLDLNSKGDIDYSIFKKNEWNKTEIKDIEKYLKQDLILTKKLYEWYEKQFECLIPLMSEKDANKLNYIKSTSASLSYQIICNQAGLPVEWSNEKPINLKSFSGGHHITPRWNLVRGNIIELDFTSAYPHALMMGNLYSKASKGWKGNGYYRIKGCYDNKKMGRIETAIQKIFLQRLEAKKKGDKIKSQALKLIINSLYGATADWKFKSIYNPITASDCTSIARTWMKKLAKHLEENGFRVLYGFTDSVFIVIPEESSKEELLFLVKQIIEEFKVNLPFPLDTFNLDVDEEIKMIWFVTTNCYLWVDKENKIGYKQTLLNSNTPKVIMQLFEDYISPKIIKSLDVDFSEQELIKELQKILKSNPELAGEQHNVRKIAEYPSKTSLQYQISEKYGEGKHFLIPNLKNIGIGKNKKYCTFEEFKCNKLKYEDIDISQLIKHLKSFYTKPKEISK